MGIPSPAKDDCFPVSAGSFCGQPAAAGVYRLSTTVRIRVLVKFAKGGMLQYQMEDDPLKIKLRYNGDFVDDGTMPISDVITALQGFAGAYGKAANELLPSSTHELKVSAINEGSFELAILAWIGVAQAEQTFEAMRSIVKGARWVFGVVRDVIEAKKHIRSGPYTVSVTGDHNTTVVINAEGASLPLAPEALRLLQSKLLDVDLGKIASPLSEGMIDTAEITARDTEGTLESTISVSEKLYFAHESSGETSAETEIDGTLISLNKETFRGTFKKGDSVKVPYHFTGEGRELFISSFSHRGIVRVSCIAHFDETLTVKHLDITRVIRLQPELPFFTGEEAQSALPPPIHGPSDLPPSQE